MVGNQRDTLGQATHVFVTSSGLGVKEQVVDLRSKGFSTRFLDTKPPILVKEIAQSGAGTCHY